MGPIFLTLQWLRGCYKGFAPFCATLSVKDPSVRSGEFLSRWRIFIADEIFYRRIFHRWGAGLFLCPLGIWGGPGFSGISGGYGARRAVGFALSGLWGGGGCFWAVSKLEYSAHTPLLSSFILLLSFSDTLLVVSILVYDCHLWPLLQP